MFSGESPPGAAADVWAMMEDTNPAFRRYQDGRGIAIPMVVLEPNQVVLNAVR
jgi:hypothetical protein